MINLSFLISFFFKRRNTSYLLLFISLLLFHVPSFHTQSQPQPVLFSEWVMLNYTWDSSHTYSQYSQNGQYIPENCLLCGINVDITGDIYVTVPRWREGVPGTLNKLDQETLTLTPYPSWDIQQVGVEGDLQNCQSMTIDNQRRMWVIDVGRRNFFGPDPDAIVNGPAGLWIIDLETSEVLTKYYFPEEVVSYTDSFLNDIVVDDNLDIAYLTDAWGEGAIVVYDLITNTSRRYSGPSTEADSSYIMIINGVNYGNQIFTTPIDGIAITEDFSSLFYTQVQGTTLYRLPTSVLNNFSTSDQEIQNSVEFIGYKDPSDGMKYMNGNLYWGSLTSSTYYYVSINDTSYPFLPFDQIVSEINTTTLHWIDTFAIDLQTLSSLWFVSNRLDLYSTYTMDFSGNSGANMRIMYIKFSEDSNTTEDVEDDDDGSDGGNIKLGYVVLFCILGFFFITIIIIVIYRRRKAKQPSSDLKPLLLNLL